jgi:GT2 family glycosyltransferase
VSAAITVVVVTRNRRPQLSQTLLRLRNLPERPPVVVVDNGSGDGTADEVRRSGAVLIRCERNLGAAGRTLGVRAARTPYVAFCDDDSWWAPGSLPRAVERFAGAHRLGLLAARVVVEPGGTDDPVCAQLAAGPYSPAGRRIMGFLACGAVVRRSAYLGVGGFHPQFGVGGEEDLLALDLTVHGWWCCYAPELVAHHAPTSTPRGTARRRREARNALWTAWLRRRPAGLLRRTSAVLRAGWRDPQTWVGTGAAVAGLPWVLAQRRPVDTATESLRSYCEALPIPLAPCSPAWRRGGR